MVVEQDTLICHECNFNLKRKYTNVIATEVTIISETVRISIFGTPDIDITRISFV